MGVKPHSLTSLVGVHFREPMICRENGALGLVGCNDGEKTRFCCTRARSASETITLVRFCYLRCGKEANGALRGTQPILHDSKRQLGLTTHAQSPNVALSSFTFPPNSSPNMVYKDARPQ